MPFYESYVGYLRAPPVFPSLHSPGTITFFLVLAPVVLFGRRVICGFACPCVGIRETPGFPFRYKTIRGDWANRLRHIKWLYFIAYMGVLVVTQFPPTGWTTSFVGLFGLTVALTYFGSFYLEPMRIHTFKYATELMRNFSIYWCWLCTLIYELILAETCIECYQIRDKKLLDEWQQSGHASSSCQDCHDSNQDTSHTAINARINDSCINCHQGNTEHSYSTSKHGVTVGLERKRTDWSKPLTHGNYRAPSCAYCHMYGGNHNTASTINNIDPTHITTICSSCHNPRYINVQLAAVND